jgi:hypothetical protein
MKNISVLVLCLALVSCGRTTTETGSGATPPSSPVGSLPIGNQSDGSVIKGRVTVNVGTGTQTHQAHELDQNVGDSNNSITYTDGPNVTFTVNTATFLPGVINGTTLSLGDFILTALNDNNLEVCGPNNNAQCTTAVLRVYTTGTLAGFVNTTDPSPYGVNVFTSGLNPTIPVVLGEPGVVTETFTILPTTHQVIFANFPNHQFNVTADFSNAGEGTYQMTYVFEYALLP